MPACFYFAGLWRWYVANEKAERLREQAERCRRLAEMTTNLEVARALLQLAEELEEQAAAEEARDPCHRR